ncbi:DUF418 domain-containing protein [Flavihumibacter solisilvae]|uniref:DUF418 domain-containing protein n=1 Tax=Flavihumibacter solisilvae TaxID=1349421 RepID=A0A0C1L2M9_9BACT|nr:DUF418 domain-containing protein [Flavihumibacter solisilvae]KIC93851.1 hypothetical protein OI18_14760 [Flavihumibacter solisilvae]
MPEFHPSSKPERIEVIDALRGLALLGILLANVPYSSEATAVDAATKAGFHLLIDKKFITIFSMLFGFGSFIQFQRATENGIAFRPYFFRRMLLLFLIGCVHAYLFWFGDILRDYAICGMALLLVYRWPAKKQLIAGATITVIATGTIYILNGILEPQYSYDRSLILVHPTTLSYLQYLEINMTIDPFVNFIQDKPITLAFCFGNMLLGFSLARLGFFQYTKQFRKVRRKLILFGATVGLLCSYLYWLVTTGKLELTPALAWLPLVIVAGMVLQSLFYISLFIELSERSAWTKLLLLFAPIGRMALTNYLLQTVFYLLVFFHWTNGLKLFGHISISQSYLLAVAFFILQAILSNFWLRYHRQGPVEKLWKKMAYSFQKNRVQAGVGTSA